MSRDFVAELKGIIADADARTVPYVPLYSIHKRSLPVGTDHIVIMRVPLEEARELIRRFFKTKISHSGVIYYDIVPSDGTLDELDVLYNPKDAFCK